MVFCSVLALHRPAPLPGQAEMGLNLGEVIRFHLCAHDTVPVTWAVRYLLTHSACRRNTHWSWSGLFILSSLDWKFKSSGLRVLFQLPCLFPSSPPSSNALHPDPPGRRKNQLDRQCSSHWWWRRNWGSSWPGREAEQHASSKSASRTVSDPVDRPILSGTVSGNGTDYLYLELIISFFRSNPPGTVKPVWF